MSKCDKVIQQALQSWDCKIPTQIAIKHACLLKDTEKESSPSPLEVGGIGLGASTLSGTALGAIINALKGESIIQGMRTGAMTGLGVGVGGGIGGLAGLGIGKAVAPDVQIPLNDEGLFAGAGAVGGIGGVGMGGAAGGKLMYELAQRMPQLGKKKKKRRKTKKKKK